MTIFVDLDGVLANFDKLCFELMGCKRHEPHSNEIWPVLTKHQDFFKCLEQIPDAMILWDAIKHLNPIILTAIPRANTFPTAEEDKREWVKKYLGPEVEFRTGPYARDKANHCKGPKDVLIDDNPLNICQWHKAGGIAIPHVSAKITIKCLREVGVLPFYKCSIKGCENYAVDQLKHLQPSVCRQHDPGR